MITNELYHRLRRESSGNIDFIEVSYRGQSREASTKWQSREALVEEGARVLNELASLIDTKRMKKPSFKMVVTAVGDCAYAREDGVLVCPIGSLKP